MAALPTTFDTRQVCGARPKGWRMLGAYDASRISGGSMSGGISSKGIHAGIGTPGTASIVTFGGRSKNASNSVRLSSSMFSMHTA
jgi:hypothetical protein